MTRSRDLLALPRFLDPVLALIFGALWVVAEAGRVRPVGFGGGLGEILFPSGLQTLWAWLGLYVLAIALCRFAPVVSLVIVAAVPSLQILGILGPPESTTWPIYAAVLYVAVALGASESRRLARTALVVGIVQAALVAVAMVVVGDWVSWAGQGMTILGRPGPGIRGDMRAQWLVVIAVTGIVFFVAAWGAGFVRRVLGRRAAEAERLDRTERELRDAALELTGVKERAAIAQEVHDVLAHSLAVVIAIADGARFLRATRADESGQVMKVERTDESLGDIAATARSALLDLRRLIEELTESQARPMPDMSELEPLLKRVRTAGLQVELTVLGEAAVLTPAQELSVLRIVQEALTNALRHAGERPRAHVTLDWRGPGLSLSVSSTGELEGDASRAADRAVESAHQERRGFGVAGMKDRARLAGGWLAAGPDGGGYLVTAYVPVGGMGEATA